MGIKESNLPIAESLGSGDKLRIVTSEGESKQIGADVTVLIRVGIATKYGATTQYIVDKTYDELRALNKSVCVVVWDYSGTGADSTPQLGEIRQKGSDVIINSFEIAQDYLKINRVTIKSDNSTTLDYAAVNYDKAFSA